MWNRVSNDDLRIHSQQIIFSGAKIALTMKAHMPPKAKAPWKIDTAVRPLRPKQWFMMSIYVSWPDSFALSTISRIVQSVKRAIPKSKARPVRQPDAFREYGRPIRKDISFNLAEGETSATHPLHPLPIYYCSCSMCYLGFLPPSSANLAAPRCPLHSSSSLLNYDWPHH